ncbi:MAG: N-acetylglucosamine-6-phosphate deacetylase [Clostridiales bacterium]|nr:N-acetylglucosamine-6-phosphate deacetylase [Clostridiales bacterium]
MKVIKGGIVYQGDGWRYNADILLENGKILDIVPSGSYEGEQVVNVDGCYVCPGFIDIHIHGCAGRDVMDGSVESLEEMAKFVAGHGTTSFLATTTTSSLEATRNSLKAVNEIMKKQSQGAQIIGVHLEGPFINSRAKGAQAEKYILPASRDNFAELVGEYEGIVRRITMAPDIEGAQELTEYLVNNGIVVSMGHTAASYEKCIEGIEWGMSHATHFYNAMTPLKHREPGAVGAFMEREDTTIELIADFVHVHPVALKIAVGVKGFSKVALITDSLAATGMDDGEYFLGSEEVVVVQGVARLKRGGNLAGSTLTQDQALRNMVSIGFEVNDVIRMLVEVPAAIAGVGHRKGRIEKGFDADLVILDKNLNVNMVFINGNRY